MSRSQEQFDAMMAQQSKPVGITEAVKEAVFAIAPGLKDFGAEAGAQLRHMGSHGSHELAALLFNNQAFVMYPRGTREDTGVHGPQDHEQQLQQERGGRDM